MIKQTIENLLQHTVQRLQSLGELPAIPAFIQVDVSKDKRHGDFSSNIAMILAKIAQKKPQEIAKRITQVIAESPYLLKIEIAGPGFINFFLSQNAFNQVILKILKEKENYGRSSLGRNKQVQIEFVSSNPTGPLHVGHGRHAAFGAVVANLLEAVGFKVYREYYINDAGRQMDILTVSIWLRYLELCGDHIVFPVNAYKGSYVIDIARILQEKYQAQLQIPSKDFFMELPANEAQGGDKELYIDAVIERARKLLKEKYQEIFDLGLKCMLDDIRNDLEEFGVHFDQWFSERKLVHTNVVDAFLEKLAITQCTYERDHAIWFRSTDFGDEKDRVLVRSNGQCTYFCNDAAYHLNKFERGFDLLIDIFGADHHGYIPRMKAVIKASGIDPERLIYLLVQFVTLYRGGEQVQMSTRGGNFVTLRELRQEVGNDAARFFYVMRKSEQHMDFDLDLAKSQSNENPVYYVQYAYARICSVFKQLSDKMKHHDEKEGFDSLHLLTQNEEHQLLLTLSRYPEIVTQAALQYEPYQLTNFLRELATDFHAYYNSHQFIVDNDALRNARLSLISVVQQTLLNGLMLLGVSAPESM